MKLKVQSIHFDADQKLLNFIHEKVNKISHLHDDIISGEVFLKLEKKNVPENKITEIKLQVPGKILFAKEQCHSFEAATDLAIESLLKQVKKQKEKARKQ